MQQAKPAQIVYRPTGAQIVYTAPVPNSAVRPSSQKTQQSQIMKTRINAAKTQNPDLAKKAAIMMAPEGPDEDSGKLLPKLRSLLNTQFNTRLGLMLRIFENGDTVVGHLAEDEGCENPLDERDDLGSIRAVGRDLSDDITPRKAARALQKDSMVVPLVYDHDEETWSLFENDGMREVVGTGERYYDGIWVPNDDCRIEIKSRARRKGIDLSASARELAQECCNTHRLWMIGECYYWVITRFNINGEQVETDSCGGYLGLSEAENALHYEFVAACAAILA
jgi:hypothetical protein